MAWELTPTANITEACLTGAYQLDGCAMQPAFNVDRGPRHRRGPLCRTSSMDAAAKWMADHGLPPPARGVRNTGEQAMLVTPEHACGAYIGFVGPA